MPIGTGMSALALLLKDLGHDVIGSDVGDYYYTEDKLKEKNIEIKLFSISNIIDSNIIYILSNAYNNDNLEIQVILSKQYKYYYYHEFIGKILNKKIIAISGTHGKTTVTSFITSMLNFEYSAIIGDGHGYGCKESEYLILEACEYKEHFLAYYPEILLINNIELDHPDYYKNTKQLLKAFQSIANQTNKIIVNNDDENCKKITHKQKITFGFNVMSDYQIKLIKNYEDGHLVQVINHFKKKDYIYFVPFFGKHMIYNFIGSIVLCLEMNKIPNLEKITLPNRRLTTIMFGNTIIIDDYAHHPTEISCLYDTLHLKYPNYSINVIFQPHTYSRTLKFKKEFVKVLSKYNVVYIEKVFTSKREGYSDKKEKKVKKIFKRFNIFSVDVLKNINEKNKELWIFLGAGNVDQYIQLIYENKK